MIGSVPMGQILFSALLAFTFSLQSEAKLLPEGTSTQSIYGKDERTFVSSKSPVEIKKLSNSIAMIISKEAVELKWLTAIINGEILSDKNTLNLCADEKFSGHHFLNSCTGFLIAPDLMATAGHCFLSEDDCRNKLVVFDVLEKNEFEQGYKVSKKSVYECKEIVKSDFNAEVFSDFAVIRLNKKITGRAPLRLRSKGDLATSEAVFMIGHPLGLPMVATGSARVIENSEDHFFKATLDSFEGNSGSPVFNAKTFEVEGILVRGEEDFAENSEKQCQQYKTYEELSGKGESITKIKDLN